MKETNEKHYASGTIVQDDMQYSSLFHDLSLRSKGISWQSWWSII